MDVWSALCKRQTLANTQVTCGALGAGAVWWDDVEEQIFHNGTLRACGEPRALAVLSQASHPIERLRYLLLKQIDSHITILSALWVNWQECSRRSAGSV